MSFFYLQFNFNFAAINNLIYLIMKEDNKELTCLFCKKSEDEIPLFQLKYKGQEFRICPQHVPILIHNPNQLIGMLEGAEGFEAG